MSSQKPQTQSPLTSPQQMQAHLETLYLARLALEHENNQLRALHPVICQIPASSGTLMRALRRAVPMLRRRYERALVSKSGLFDAQWYLRTYPDVAQAGVDPLRHFLAVATTELRDPGPYFNTAHYLSLYPDIAAHNLNPLVHYLRAGWHEQRSIRQGMPTDNPPRSV